MKVKVLASGSKGNVTFIEKDDTRILIDIGMNAKYIEEKLKEPGYREIGTDLFVPQSEAYNYALQRCLNGTESDQKEFKEMLVEWFYSGNWVKE